MNQSAGRQMSAGNCSATLVLSREGPSLTTPMRFEQTPATRTRSSPGRRAASSIRPAWRAHFVYCDREKTYFFLWICFLKIFLWMFSFLKFSLFSPRGASVPTRVGDGHWWFFELVGLLLLSLIKKIRRQGKTVRFSLPHRRFSYISIPVVLQKIRLNPEMFP